MRDIVLTNGKITTLDPAQPTAEALAIRAGKVVGIGTTDAILKEFGKDADQIDLHGRTVIPGLNDSHTHLIRGGLNYTMELRWDGIPSLRDALELLRIQAVNTPPPQWVRVVGGWSEFQFQERRMPTLEEINAAAPDTPVFILHLYGQALLNQAAIRALGYDTNPPDFDRGLIERDQQGRSTGMLIAKPSAAILYQTLALAPRLQQTDQIISTRHFMRELNRLGITSVIDAGGGGQYYPDDYAVVQQLAEQDQLTVRIAYNLFAQKPQQELDEIRRWVQLTRPGASDGLLQLIGAGENLTWAAADFENFLEPRPDLAATMEQDLQHIVEVLVSNRWPFRVHATYNESIERFLQVFETVHRSIPFDGLHWMIDHAETISDRNIERVRELGGGIAIQHRMAFQGEYFVDRYGQQAAQRTPPIRRMLELGVPVGAGTDATRVASYNPWVCLYWLVTGKTLGGLSLYPAENTLDRLTALRLWTQGSAWFSSEEQQKGTLALGQYADLAVLSADFFSVEPEDIQRLTSVLTMVDGKVVYAVDEFQNLAPPLPPVSPDWSPLTRPGGQQGTTLSATSHHTLVHQHTVGCHHHSGTAYRETFNPWSGGCGCFAF
ncbi:MAG: amidohydrolase [Chloroflexota bacterium]